jgi:acyl-coenzyme A thioesterase PaaI-like protein
LKIAHDFFNDLAHFESVQRRIMHVTDLAIHKLLGIELASPGSSHILELPESALVRNHVGTVHAGVQFALAEACSGEFLLEQFEDDENISGVVIAANVKYRSPARGKLRASAQINGKAEPSVKDRLSSRRRIFVSVLVQVTDTCGSVTMEGQYDWLLQRTSTA